MADHNLIGARVQNRKNKAIGTIVAVEGNKITVDFHGTEAKYLYPDCFYNVLELEDEELGEELQKEGMEVAFDTFKKTYLHAFIDEINYIKASGGKRYRAMEGVRLPSQNNEYIYTFDTDTDMRFPAGTKLKLYSPFGIKTAYVVSCEEFSLTFRMGEHIGDSIDMLEFSVEEWFLLEAIQDRLNELDSDESELAYEIACRGKNQIDRMNAIRTGQNYALSRATSEPITFIWGPPGTGKTETLAKIALEHIQNGKRVLMLSYSNVSVDGAMLRVASKADFPMGEVARYGYPRLEELLEKENLISYRIVIKQNPKLDEEYRLLVERKKTLKNKDPEKVEINKRLAKIRELYKSKEQELVQNAAFVATTVSKAVVDETIYRQKFDVVIFDEASMAYVPQIVFAASLAKEHFICLGDFCQLPAIAQNPGNEKLMEDIFEYTGITEAVSNGYSHNWLVMLSMQFRMHKEIADFASKSMYSDLLETSDTILDLRDAVAQDVLPTNSAVSMVDISRMYSVCIKTMDGSRVNLLSALICLRLAEICCEKYEVGIITPYSAQSRLILSLIRDLQEVDKRYGHISCATVHQFQGSEKPVIIYDAVDCFRMPFPGMLLTSQRNNSSNRLFNVALTRAQGKFIAVANKDFLVRKKISEKLMFTQYMKLINKYKKNVEGNKIIEILAAGDDSQKVFVSDRDNSWEIFANDLRAAEKTIRISMPGDIDDDEDKIVELMDILKQKSETADVSIKLDEQFELPPGLSEYVTKSSFVTMPVTIVDNKVLWYGHPLAAQDFITEGEILETLYFPCVRVEGHRFIRSVKAFIGL